MDKVIIAARDLGRIIQEDERYIRYMVAKQQNDEDAELQEKIANFQRLRDELSARMGENPNAAKTDAANGQMRAAYAEIFENESMARFTKIKNEMDGLLGFVNQILSAASNGEDPETVEYRAPGCSGGSCGSCGGCGGA
ncbi:MAG: YlbF family regulator [Oscillospiraceae bacterium]|nr:YlbF family regulator [Oscillospiraceae bacterium]